MMLRAALWVAPLMSWAGAAYAAPISLSGGSTNEPAEAPAVALTAPPDSASLETAGRHGAQLERPQRTADGLPDKPMRPRRWDPRVGFASTTGGNSGGYWPDAAYTTGPGRFILRYRLEKKDPSAPVSDVVQPIVFRIDTGTVPYRWRRWIARGVEAWLPVLEAAGFRKALVVREERYIADNVQSPDCWIWWGENTADGDRRLAFYRADTVDQRTGELLRGWISLNAALMDRLEAAAFLGTGAAMQYPFRDTVAGMFLRTIIMWQVGHALGLVDNDAATTAYPTDSLRSASFLRRAGFNASVVNNQWLNYVAQPEDRGSVLDRIGRIGPYDKWAIAWGYRPIPEAKTPDDEAPTLERWRAAQDADPTLRAGTADSDTVGRVGEDPIAAAQNGVRNLALAASKIDAQQDPSLYFSKDSLHILLQKTLVTLWPAMVRPVIAMVGGTVKRGTDTTGVPIDSAHQVAAFRAVIDHLLSPQDPLLHAVTIPSDGGLVLFQSVSVGHEGDWRGAQALMLEELLSQDRMKQLAAQSSATHAMPAICHEIQLLSRNFKRMGTGDPGGNWDRQRMQDAITKALKQSNGGCGS